MAYSLLLLGIHSPMFITLISIFEEKYNTLHSQYISMIVNSTS